MADRDLHSSNFRSPIDRPEVGTALTILSGLAFLMLSMFLPLVGKSGVKTEHYGANLTAFLVLLLITMVLSGLAIKSKLSRRKIDGSPFPMFSSIIGGLCLLLFVSLLLGLLHI